MTERPDSLELRRRGRRHELVGKPQFVAFRKVSLGTVWSVGELPHASKG